MADDPRRHQMLPLDARRALRVLAWLVAAALQVDPIAVVVAAFVEPVVVPAVVVVAAGVLQAVIKKSEAIRLEPNTFAFFIDISPVLY